MEFRLQAGQALAQMGPEYLSEQRVELVPRVPEVFDERVVAVQPGENGLGIGPKGQRVGQIGTEALQDTDPQQEALCLLRLSLEDLGQQEVRDRTAVRLELLQVQLRVGALQSGQGGQAQAAWPSPGCGPPGRPRRGPEGSDRAVPAVRRPLPA